MTVILHHSKHIERISEVDAIREFTAEGSVTAYRLYRNGKALIVCVDVGSFIKMEVIP